MKKLQLVLLLLCLAVNAAYAQNDTVEFYLTIPDKSIIANVEHIENTVTPVFNDPEINQIIDNYEITEWKKAFPTSMYEESRWKYIVRCNSIQLAHDLVNYNSEYFPEFKQFHRELCATPSDYNGWNGQVQLNYINAPGAWNYTTGNPNVVIGVTDTYFDLNHPDMSGQYAQVRDTTNFRGGWFHGMVVAGLVACKTNNGSTGMASIGYNCRLDVSTNWGSDGELLRMSQQGRKVVNASWMYDTSHTLNYRRSQYYQPTYNEIYENGTLAVVAAGNARPTIEGNNRNYTYPASLDHNFCVTGVGFENDTSNKAGVFNAKDVHEHYAGDTTRSHQHNLRVDLCAPSVRVSSLYYNRDSPVHYKWHDAWGTSFAAPMVAGTAGLMLSANPWLTPYQMEYILKTTAKNIYGNQFNAKYYGTNPYNGRLGAGVLNAGNAVMGAADLPADYYATRTFIIEGIDINTNCKPGLATNGALPILTVRLKNGVGPYTYRWEPVIGNQVDLSSLDVAAPTVLSAARSNLLYYRLTVYDNSPIKKVANRYIKIKLISDGMRYDLAMQDHFADVLDERNSMDTLNPRHWSIWESPNLINKYTTTLDAAMRHQNPNFDSTNYLHVKIMNVGCTNSPEAQVHLYWTMPSTGETWPDDWKGLSPLFNGHPVGGEITPANGLVIPPLPPGQGVILTQHWPNVPRPQDYDSSGMISSLESCVLARIVEPNALNQGMNNEQLNLNVKENVWENNNIVTRNLIVTNFNNSMRKSTSLVLVATTGADHGQFTIEMLTEKDVNPHYAGNLSRYLTATLHLGALFDVWAEGGRIGNAIAVDDEAKTITYDFSKPLRLENISLQSGDRFPVFIEFNMKDGVSVPYPVEDQLVYFRQLTQYQEEIDMGDGTTMLRIRDNTYGNISFAINITADEAAAQKPSSIMEIKTAQPAFTLYPNPVSDKLIIKAIGQQESVSTLSLVDLSGRTIITKRNVTFNNSQYEIETKALKAGIYFIKLIDSKGKIHSLRFTRLD